MLFDPFQNLGHLFYHEQLIRSVLSSHWQIFLIHMIVCVGANYIEMHYTHHDPDMLVTTRRISADTPIRDQLQDIQEKP